MCTRKRQQCPLFNPAVFNTFFLSLGNLQCHEHVGVPPESKVVATMGIMKNIAIATF